MSAKTIVDLNLNEGKNNMIPKIVHYCWFGGNPLAEDAKNVLYLGRNTFQIMKSRSGMSQILMSIAMLM